MLVPETVVRYTSLDEARKHHTEDELLQAVFMFQRDRRKRYDRNKKDQATSRAMKQALARAAEEKGCTIDELLDEM